MHNMKVLARAGFAHVLSAVVERHGVAGDDVGHQARASCNEEVLERIADAANQLRASVERSSAERLNVALLMRLIDAGLEAGHVVLVRLHSSRNKSLRQADAETIQQRGAANGLDASGAIEPDRTDFETTLTVRGYLESVAMVRYTCSTRRAKTKTGQTTKSLCQLYAVLDKEGGEE